MSIVNVENVTHMYGDKITFKNISFQLFSGEHAALVGRNGTGKSTLLKLLTSELLPDTGVIEWFPYVKTGFLQQHIDLPSGMTIRQYLQKAFAQLFEIEKNMLSAAEEMAAGNGILEKLLSEFGEWQARLDQADFYQIDAKIDDVAAGLGLFELGMNRDVGTLSGGQRTKLLLGKLLLEEPDVLLLDEPTNFLDDRHIKWLMHYLKNYRNAYIVVSHDKTFLNEVSTVIYHLEHQTIKRYKGNYEAFLKGYEQYRQQLDLAYEKQKKEIDKLERFIDKYRNRKAKQAKSREKMLGRIDRIERPLDRVMPRFDFHVNRQAGTRIVKAEALEIGYTHSLFGPIDLQVKRGEKIAIVGCNGVGKSTMLKTLLGQVQPIDGTVYLGEQVKPAYFAQEEFASEETPLERISSLRPEMTHKGHRQALARVGLTAQHTRQPLYSLSGGEQTKVRLCELMLTESNVLVLDEPTNHLDIQTKLVFKDALSNYTGTILLVSHEPDFYEGWITAIWNVEDWCKGTGSQFN